MTDQPKALSLAQVAPVVSRGIRKAAKNVLNLGYEGRSTPEQVLERKQAIAAYLEALAGTVDAALAKADDRGAA